MAGRGPDPEDAVAWRPAVLPDLRRAVADLSWLLGRGYSPVAALKLVGDHLQLSRRQRAGVLRCACSDAALASRRARQVASVAGREALVDGFNQLITLERALAGGPVLRGRDGVVRDLAGVHGTYRTVAVTPDALAVAARVLAEAAHVAWVFDAPVSNSGRVAEVVRAFAAAKGLPWDAETVAAPDRTLRGTDRVAVTSDGPVLDACGAWFDLVGPALPEGAWCVDLGGG